MQCPYGGSLHYFTDSCGLLAWQAIVTLHRGMPSWPCHRGHAIVAMPSWPCHLGHAIVALPSRSWHRDAGIMTMWPARSRDRGESTFAGLDSMLWIQCSGFELGYVKAVPARRREDVSHRRREVRIDAFEKTGVKNWGENLG